MRLAGAIPASRADPETCEVRADGARPTRPPADLLPMARRDVLF